MDVISILQALAVVTLTIVTFIIIFQKTSQQNYGHYYSPDWNFAIKKYWAKLMVRRKRRNIFEYTADFCYYRTEPPPMLDTEDSFDSQLIYGSDQNGNSLLIKFVKRKNDTAEIWLILRFSDGRVFTLAEHPPLIMKSNVNSNKFEAAGLVIEPLVAYKTWRIVFTGHLRQGIEDDNKDLKFIKFNFIWASSGNPKHWPDDWSLELKAIALATESWRSSDWINYIHLPKFGGYDQFGALLGQVFIEKEASSENDAGNDSDEMNSVELNLPGLRQRRFLANDNRLLRRSVSFIGVCKDGSIYVIGAESFAKQMTQYQFGFLRRPNGQVYPIDWTDLHLANIAEDTDRTPSAITIQFKADHKMYTTTAYFRKNTLISLNGYSLHNWSANLISTEIGLNGERGQGVAILWYSKKDQSIPILSQDNRKFKCLVNSNALPERQKLAYTFDEIEASSLVISGGKGASLTLLQSILNQKLMPFDYQIPFGFILSVSAFDLQIYRYPIIRDAVNAIREAACSMNSQSLAEVCEKTVRSIECCPLDADIVNTVTEFYNNLQATYKKSSEFDFRVAVRSSAIGEDSEDTSSAGQNETFLGLTSLVDVLSAIKKCWASLYSYQSVEYRRQHVQEIVVQMSVVVQIMVPSDSAGVMFTKHPTNGDPSKMVITANYGLGESVVSGCVEPDVYVVKRGYKNDKLKIVQTKIGNKLHSLNMSISKDTIELIESKKLTKEEQEASCLTTDQILRLSEIGIHLERLYGNARDIEWAIYQNNIYLLQSRPITTSNSFTNWELLHEFDTAIMSEDDLSTFANVGEVLPGLTSPLSNSIVARSLNNCTSELIADVKDPCRGLFAPSIVFSNHRLCFDVYSVFFQIVDKEIQLINTLSALLVFGNEFYTPEMNKIAIHRNGIASTLNRINRSITVIKALWSNKGRLKKMEKFMKTYGNRYSPDHLHEFKNHNAQLFAAQIDFDLDDEDRFEAFVRTHNYTSMASTFCQLITLIVLLENNSVLTSDHYADIAMMLGSCKNVESAEIPKGIEEITTEIYNSGKSEEFVKILPTDGIDWLRSNCQTASLLFLKFIQKNSHRSLKELDLCSITWGMKPEIVIEMIQSNLKMGFSSMSKNKLKTELTEAEIIQRLKTPKKALTRIILAKLLPLCKKSIQYRETTKSQLTAFIHELRKAFRHLAVLMNREGLLPNTELIFYLTRNEIRALLDKPLRNGPVVNKSLIVNKAMRRMKMFPTWSIYRFNDVNSGVLKPIINDEIEDENNWTEDDSDNRIFVKGMPVCEGIITSRACVIQSFAHVSEIRPGDILITYSTDIGWSPYFPMLGGVVTELGGLLSHGAVVAREYGLPCIIGAVGATSKVRHGDIVTMNASKGIIVKV